MDERDRLATALETVVEGDDALKSRRPVKAPAARKQGPVSQADLDLQDGICLAYLERMMKIWNGAHEKDPSIPQLLPIATRPIFAPTTKKKKDAAAAAEAPPAEVAAAGTVDPAGSAGKTPA